MVSEAQAQQTDGGEAQADSGIYVYSIIESHEPRSFGKIGIGGRGDEVFTVHYRDLAALVSRTPLVVYDPNRENALAHEHVNEVAIEQGFTPVPMSFGTLFKTEKEIVKNQQSSTYFARMQLGRMVEQALADTSDAYVREIYEYLRDAAIASRSNKPIGERMIMNAAFLVERDKADTFDRKVQDIAQKFEGKLNFRYTGPWPPYNFVTIRLQLERSAVV